MRLQAARGRALALSGQDDEAREICGRMMQRARELDDPETTRLAYTALLFTAWTPDTVHELLDAARSFRRLRDRRRRPRVGAVGARQGAVRLDHPGSPRRGAAHR